MGHTGNYEAAIKAIETLDTCIGRVTEAIKKTGGECLITADHGNAEQMTDPETGQAHTAHTSEPVPLVYIGRPDAVIQQEGGILSDIAPTILNLMDLPKPEEMTGNNLISFK